MKRAVLLIWAAGLCRADEITGVGQLDSVAVAAVEWDAGFRGVRLTPGAGKAVLISTHEAVALARILRGLDADIRRASATPRGVIGACEFRDRPGEFPVTADYDTRGPGLRMHFEQTVLLKDRMPGDLAALLDAALAKLRGRLR